MAQNGTEFVAGVDTYNGTTAYASYDTYKRCGGKELLKIDLRVAHVGGGQLKIHGLCGHRPAKDHEGFPTAHCLLQGPSCGCHLRTAGRARRQDFTDPSLIRL